MSPSRASFGVLSLALLMGAAGTASADPQPSTAQGASSKVSIDGHFRLLEGHLDRFGPGAALFGPGGLSPGVRLSGAGGSLRFYQPPSAALLARLEGLGVEFVGGAKGGWVHVGEIYPAWIPFSAVEPLRGVSELIRVECAWRRQLRPLDQTVALTGAAALRRRPDVNLDGEGVLVATIDSPIDVLHPHLFAADGGYAEWVDVDGDGKGTAGVDGVDLDGDGMIGADERLAVLDGPELGYPQTITNDDQVLAPRLDWLYVDTNGNGRRDAGPENGFTEGDLAYGEPLFVVDDANRNDKLDPGEQLVRLGTSKIVRARYGAVDYIEGGGFSSLINSMNDPATEDALHGTGVASILVGGQAGFHDRIGMAPAARLAVFSNTAGRTSLGNFGDTEVIFIQAAQAMGAVLILHEWTDPFGTVQDGSTNVEAAMNTARAAGMAQINPLGNLNLAGKHVEREVEAGGTVALGIEIGPGYQRGPETSPYAVVYGLLMATGSPPNALSIQSPSGERQVIEFNGQPMLISPGTYAAATQERTPRGTTAMLFYVYSEDQITQLEVGQWTVSLDGFEGAATVYGRVSDYYTSWGEGVGWTTPTVDTGTLVFPSTADSAFGVAAYGGINVDFLGGDQPGELRSYSGRGPRMDGAQAVDITAPDDPYAALAHSPALEARGLERGYFQTFGGTSGAGPHVAGAYALLAQKWPDADPDTLEGALTAAAQREGLKPAMVDGHDSRWGYGRMDVWAAVSEGARPEPVGAAPVARLALSVVGAQLRLDATASSASDGAPLWFRFDAGYDGEWDADWARDGVLEIPVDEVPAVGRVRLDVRAADGQRRGVIMPYRLDELSPAEADAGPGGDSGADVGPGVDGGVVISRLEGGGASGCSGAPSDSGPPWGLFLLSLPVLALRRRPVGRAAVTERPVELS